jgi:DNA-binding transcriptional MerR regulator
MQEQFLKSYTIKDVVKMIDVPKGTIYQWEKDLELHIPRREDNSRYYTEFEIDLLLKIKNMRDKNLSIPLIKDLLHAKQERGIEEELSNLPVTQQETTTMTQIEAVAILSDLKNLPRQIEGLFEQKLKEQSQWQLEQFKGQFESFKESFKCEMMLDIRKEVTEEIMKELALGQRLLLDTKSEETEQFKALSEGFEQAKLEMAAAKDSVLDSNSKDTKKIESIYEALEKQNQLIDDRKKEEGNRRREEEFLENARRVLRVEALEEWKAKPHSERYTKIGLFRKSEDITKRDIFIEKFIEEHLKNRIANNS